MIIVVGEMVFLICGEYEIELYLRIYKLNTKLKKKFLQQQEESGMGAVGVEVEVEQNLLGAVEGEVELRENCLGTIVVEVEVELCS